jgi:hypothetical protein
MASDDSSGSRPAAPIVLRIKLRYDDVEAMVQRFAANVGKSGLFLPTRSLQPLGSEIKFELRLADDTPVLVGLGRVKAARPPDPQHPRMAFGMAIELMRVTPQSRALILRMLERRRELGLPELGLPMAPDIDAARRAEAGESGGRDLATGPVPVVVPVAASAPVAPPPAASIEVPPGEALLTAPRSTIGPMATAKVLAVAPLPPEPPRKRRMAISEIIESASGPVASVSAAVPGLDDDVDIAAALVRARALAGGALDAELEALSQVAAAPLEISIDMASAELARQLGGSAVRRDRAAGWVPPPATAAAIPASAFEVAPELSEPEPPAQPEPALAADAIPAAIADGVPAHAEAGWRSAEEADAGAAQSPPVDPDPSAALAESAALEMPAAPAPDDHGAEDDGDGHDNHRERRARAFAPAHIDQIRTEPSGPISFGSPREDSGVAAALTELDADEHTEMGEAPVEGGGFEPPAAGDGGAAASASDPEERGPEAIASPLEPGSDEFEGFEILAEADADDEDLLASNGEHDASKRRELAVQQETGGRRQSELDFAARLDLGDDSDPYIAMQAGDRLNDELTGEHARRRGKLDLASSAGAALAMFETGDESLDDAVPPGRVEPRAAVQPIFEPEPSSSFTLAGIPSDSIDLDGPPVVRRAADPARPARRAAGAIRSEPAMLRKPPPHHGASVKDDELEHALEALDVDLDDLSASHAAPQPQRDRSSPIAAVRPVSPPRTPAPKPRASVPTPAPKPRVSVPMPGQKSRAPAATPSRTVRHAGHPAPGSGGVATPRAPSESIDIDLDDDD